MRWPPCASMVCSQIFATKFVITDRIDVDQDATIRRILIAMANHLGSTSSLVCLPLSAGQFTAGICIAPICRMHRERSLVERLKDYPTKGNHDQAVSNQTTTFWGSNRARVMSTSFVRNTVALPYQHHDAPSQIIRISFFLAFHHGLLQCRCQNTSRRTYAYYAQKITDI